MKTDVTKASQPTQIPDQQLSAALVPCALIQEQEWGIFQNNRKLSIIFLLRRSPKDKRVVLDRNTEKVYFIYYYSFYSS